MQNIFIVYAIFCSTVSAAPATVIDVKASAGVEALAAKLKGLIDKSGADIIFIGEDHRDVLGKAVVTKALTETTWENSLKRCYFAEESPIYQPAFDMLPRDPERAATLHKQIFEDYKPIYKQATGEDPNYWTDFKNLESYSKNGFKIWAIDRIDTKDILLKQAVLKAKLNSPTRSQVDIKAYYDLFLKDRNQLMASNIVAQHSNQRCERSVLVVGKGHLFAIPQLTRFGILPIPQLVPLKNISINIAECVRPGACEPFQDADINFFIY